MGVIYSIMNPKGKLYVGKTYNLKNRIASHKCAAKKGKNIILHNSIRKYGWENHSLQVIEEVSDEILNERELFWIATMKTYCYENKMGMNMTRGGDGQRSTWMHDIERRKKASDYFKGENNPFYGKTVSKENKKIIGDKARDRNLKSGWKIPEWGAEKGREITRKPVLAYNIKGEFIAEFISLSAAAKVFEIDRKGITAVLCNEQTQYKEYLFQYKTSENYPLKIDASHVKPKIAVKPIFLLDNERNVIKEYGSAKEAAKDLGVHHHNIQRAAKHYNSRPIRTGQIFVYKDEYELNQVTNN